MSPPSGWSISISPHELTDYLLCAFAFFNLILAFFTDHPFPRISPRASDPPDFDILPSEEMPLESFDALENGKKGDEASEPTPVSA